MEVFALQSSRTSTMVEQLGSWAAKTSWNDLSKQARKTLKARVLDSIGCAIGALWGNQLEKFDK